MNPSGGQITFFFSLHTDSDQDLVSTPRELLNISQKTNLSRMVSQLFQLPHYVKARRHFISKLKKSDIQHTHPCVLICFSRVQLCDSVDYRPPGSSVHGILQAGVLECIAMPSSRGSSQPRDGIHVSYISCIGWQILYLQCHLQSPIQIIVINVSHSFL